MEPDPSPDSSHTIDTQITSKDIDTILGVKKRGRRDHLLYGFSTRVIILVASVTTFFVVAFYLFQQA